jgi:hypothetical protein
MYSLIKTFFYVSSFAFAFLVIAEIARPGFVSYFFHLPLFFIFVVTSGAVLIISGKKS